MRDDDLTSAGRATAQRGSLEAELTEVIRVGLAQFLRDMEDAALADSQALTAAFGVPNPFTMAKAVASWDRRVVKKVIGTLADMLRPKPPASLLDQYMVDAESRLLADGLPAKVYESAQEVLHTSMSEGWGRDHLASTLAKTLDPTSSMTTMMTTGPDDLSLPDSRGMTWRARAERIARTEATSAHGTWVLANLIEKGYLYKKWVSHHDRFTREAHLQADGDVQPITSPFIVGGEELMAPGDPNGSFEVIANCRCALVGTGETLVAGYNPMQPRDAKGMWTDSGAVGRGLDMGDPPPTTPSHGDEAGAGHWMWDEGKQNWTHPKYGDANEGTSASLTKQWKEESDRQHPPPNPDGTVSKEEKRVLDERCRTAILQDGGSDALGSYWTDSGAFGYAGSRLSFELNAAKRKGESPGELTNMDTKLHKETRLTAAPRDLPVYRSVKGSLEDSSRSMFPEGDDLTGTLFYDAGYMSTTTDKDWAFAWGQSSGAVVLEIIVPKGAPMLSLKGESEIVIPDGSTLALGKSRMMENPAARGTPLRVIEARLVKVDP